MQPITTTGNKNNVKMIFIRFQNKLKWNCEVLTVLSERKVHIYLLRRCNKLPLKQNKKR